LNALLVTVLVAAALAGTATLTAGVQPGFGGVRQEGTLDDLLLEVATRVPGFGGMFIDEDGRLAVYLLDPAESSAAEEAIAAVFGRERIPPRGVRAIQGQYGIQQLKGWYDRFLSLFSIPGVVMTDLDEGRNRLTVGVERPQVRAPVERELRRLDIPPEAVIIEVTGPIMPVPGGPTP